MEKNAEQNAPHISVGIPGNQYYSEYVKNRHVAVVVLGDKFSEREGYGCRTKKHPEKCKEIPLIIFRKHLPD